MADSMAPITITGGVDHTKLTFQSAIDEDSDEYDSSTGTDPREVARIIESKLTQTHLDSVNAILFDDKSSLRGLFKENLYLDDHAERL